MDKTKGKFRGGAFIHWSMMLIIIVLIAIILCALFPFMIILELIKKDFIEDYFLDPIYNWFFNFSFKYLIKI